MKITDDIVKQCINAYRTQHKAPLVPSAMRAALEYFEALRHANKTSGTASVNTVTVQQDVYDKPNESHSS